MLLPLALVAAVLAAPAAPAARARPADPSTPKKAPAVSVRWEPSFEAAMRKAKTAGQPVMVDFWAQWCGYCHVLDETTYVDPTVVGRSRSFVSVKVNTEGSKDESAVAGRYLVQSLPTIAFLSPGGRQLWRLDGYAPPETFMKVIDEAQAVAARILPLEAALEKNPQDVNALIALGLHQYREVHRMAASDASGIVPKSMYTDGKDLLTRAAGLDKDRPSGDRKRVRKTLGLFAAMGGDPADAEGQMKAALAVQPADPEDAEVLAAMGEVYLHLDKKELAREAFARAVKEHPDSKAGGRARRMLERLGGVLQ
jgi:thioredoxin-like negative regulator of GroEL